MSKTTIPDLLPRVAVTVPISDALYLARAGVAGASKGDITPVITGVLLSAEDGVLTALSTDRYRVHRATATVEGVLTFPPFLIPAKAFRWLIANASFFGRGMLPPTVTFELEATEATKPNPNRSGTPSPGGVVTITIRENGGDAAHLQHKTSLIAGNFPSGVVKLLDEALVAEPQKGDTGLLNLDYLASCRALASYRGENPRVWFVAGSNTAKSGQAVVAYKHGAALIQKAMDL